VYASQYIGSILVAFLHYFRFYLRETKVAVREILAHVTICHKVDGLRRRVVATSTTFCDLDL